MMRLIRILAALLFVALGAAIGALNPQPVSLDLGFAVFRGTLGVTVLAALLAGCVAGGLMLTLSVVLPQRHALRRSRSARPPTRDIADDGV